jgi:lipid-binding SYLF domain-containing protein
MCRIAHLFTCLTALSLISAPFASAGYLEEETVQAAAVVLNETMATPGHQIPQAMLADAYGVAIIPNVIKGSFVIGARHGRGVLCIREANGIWRAPVFISLTGGNIGWQVGLQSSDIILVFKTPRSVEGILSGMLTLGADAAVAAGPVGRQTAAATDGRLRAEIYAYSRSRGLFAGVSIDGSVVRMDRFATGTYYGNPAAGQPVIVPPSAQQLTESIVAYAGAAQPVAVAATAHQNSVIVEHHSASEADILRGQLAQLAPQLYELLDDPWKNYLALPASLFLSGEHPSPDQLAAVMRNFDSVTSNPQFQQLASRPEFQSVYGILKHYQQSLVATPSTLQLPPPPTAGTFVPRPEGALEFRNANRTR